MHGLGVVGSDTIHSIYIHIQYNTMTAYTIQLTAYTNNDGIHNAMMASGMVNKTLFRVYTLMAVCWEYLCVMSVWKQCYDFE